MRHCSHSCLFEQNGAAALVQSALTAHSSHRSATQWGWASGQSLFMVHWTHRWIAVSHTGRGVPAQSAFDAHTGTQSCPTQVNPAEHWLDRRHCSHCPFARLHWGFAAPQSALDVHSTQRPLAQSGSPLQSATVRHWTHWPVCVLQMSVFPPPPLQLAFDVHFVWQL